MGFYKQVKKGDPFQPNADRENEITALLGRFGGHSAGAAKRSSSNDCRVMVCNVGASTLRRFAPVKPVDAIVGSSDGGGYIFIVEAATAATDQYWVLLDELEPAGVGSALVSGAAVVEVDIKDAGDGYAIPAKYTGEDESEYYALASASSGLCRIVWKPDATGVQLALLVLGSAAESGGAYNGYFKVIVEPLEPGEPESEDNPKMIKVVDGADQASGIAGMTDIGNLAPTELAFAETGTVYLVATHNGSAYALAVGYELPDAGNYGYVELATISGGVVTQRWTGNVIYFAERYFVQL